MAGFADYSSYMLKVPYKWISWTVNITAISQANFLISISSSTINTLTSPSMSSVPITLSPVAISSNTISESELSSKLDVFVDTNTYSNYNLVVNSISYLPITLWWVASSSTTVTGVLSAWNGNPIPTFVSLDSASQQLIVNTTGLATGSTAISYWFGIIYFMLLIWWLSYIKICLQRKIENSTIDFCRFILFDKLLNS